MGRGLNSGRWTDPEDPVAYSLGLVAAPFREPRTGRCHANGPGLLGHLGTECGRSLVLLRVEVLMCARCG
jgi:hypothetical protein